jgi:nicotinamide phosphoribosyltransferase
VVLGVGSYSMGYATRDNQGGAVKATYVEVDGVGREIFKDPITDDGTKKSATGLLHVTKNSDGDFILFDKQSWDGENTGALQTIYKDGLVFNTTTLTEIRKRLKK